MRNEYYTIISRDEFISLYKFGNININTNPTLINSFLSDCLHMLELDNYYTDNFNLDTFNSKYDTLDILFLFGCFCHIFFHDQRIRIIQTFCYFCC